jgi:hypothetical protein
MKHFYHLVEINDYIGIGDVDVAQQQLICHFLPEQLRQYRTYVIQICKGGLYHLQTSSSGSVNDDIL